MKTNVYRCLMLGVAMVLLQGCVGLPSLIHIEHQDAKANQEIIQRLDNIDHRLSELEQRDKKQ